eukprot:749732_1
MASIPYEIVLFFTILVLCASFNCIFIIKTSTSLIKAWKRNTGHTLDIIIKSVFMLSAVFLILNAILYFFSYPQFIILITDITGCALYMFGLPLMLLSFSWRFNERFKGTPFN